MRDASFVPGQRWHSLTEPELGLGVVQAVEGRHVVMAYPGCAVVRRYATQDPPLARARLAVGQQARATGGESFRITAVVEEGGLLCYHGADCQLRETDLAAAVDVATPQNRLHSGQVDDQRLFSLRYRALGLRHRMLSSPARGFVGGRIRLFDHQLSVAQEVCQRHRARVLLADEVGLGKTIEALLILHRMLLCGRVERALVLVPGGLVHQWLAEAWLRFHLFLQVMGDDTHGGGTIDPESEDLPAQLRDSQLFICALEIAVGESFLDTAWDLIIVDEAHHLQPESAEFQRVERLAASVPHLILLSATPDRGGEEAHFRRLALLDPARFHDIAAYRAEAAHYRQLARTAERLQQDRAPDGRDRALLAQRLDDEDVDSLLRAAATQSHARGILLRRLLDLHGIGRVMFRNVRARVPGFPRRLLHTVTLEGDGNRMRREFLHDIGHGEEGLGPRLSEKDPRLAWLIGFLEGHPAEKVLALCTQQQRAAAWARALGTPGRPVACFHEGMGAVSRDRQAAWFLQAQGPQLVVCSALGAEGRNFQLARHLVLLDLPMEADRLEQAIGRLDRIGQGTEIHIHVPVVPGTPQARLLRWYAEALQIFSRPWHGSPTIADEFDARLLESLLATDEDACNQLIAAGQRRNAEIVAQLEAGRDRLLELGSCDIQAAATLRRVVESTERSDELERFMVDAFERAGLEVEPLGERSYALRAGVAYLRPFPGFHGEEMGVTFARATALRRPDRALLTWDHPMVRDAIDSMLGHERGNAAVARLPAPTADLWLEALYVAESTADQHLRADRFLPPTPVHVLVDTQGERRHLEVDELHARLQPVGVSLLEEPGVQEHLPGLMACAQRLAQQTCVSLSDAARRRLRRELQPQVQRLAALARVNPAVSQVEVDAVEAEFQELEAGLADVRLRLDALRLIIVGGA